MPDNSTPPEDANGGPSLKDSIARAAISAEMVKQLENQGFPEYMIYSFTETAKTTSSIILSRVPGGAGTDLINEGYDLKGFHIKAKSCNWGPMAGFICQIPLFNKAGYDKMGFNLIEIANYYKKLLSFSGIKQQIDNLEADKEKDEKYKTYVKLLAANNPQNKEDIATLRTYIRDKYDRPIANTLSDLRDIEAATGAWSGENNLPDGLPFIPLKRKFKDVAAVRSLRGVKAAVQLPSGAIYGIAQNVTDEENAAKNKPTVTCEFLLKPIATGSATDGTTGSTLYEICHGRINFKTSSGQAADVTYTGSQPDLKNLKDSDYNKLNAIATPTVLDDILKRPPAEPLLTAPDFTAITSNPDVKGFAASFPIVTAAQPFFKVNGIMNPFPPFKKVLAPDKVPQGGASNDNPQFYKNAVSGDYDLFSIWPHMDISANQLVRQSEEVVGKKMGLRGKIFTATIGGAGTLDIEFIPGFKELNPDPTKPGDVLKESADYGNMTDMGHFVAGYLNDFGTWFLSKMSKGAIASTANKAFHSDEGGRPAIIEVEFPVAVFFPAPVTSIALDNIEKGSVIPSLSVRTGMKTSAGLVKSAEEMVTLILECMRMDYRVLLHYGWLIHLLYETIETGVKKEATIKAKDAAAADAASFTADAINPFKDFVGIDSNRLPPEKFTPNPEKYLADVKAMLGAAGSSDNDFFTALREMMLQNTFLGNKLSIKKRLALEELTVNMRAVVQ